jgi:hypothetical protein
MSRQHQPALPCPDTTFHTTLSDFILGNVLHDTDWVQCTAATLHITATFITLWVKVAVVHCSELFVFQANRSCDMS